MAGVGFKLNKIFGKNTMTAGTLGVLSSPLVVVGPLFLMLMVLFGISGLLGVWQINEADIRFFATTFASISLVVILVSTLMSPIVSRYVSDKIFEEKESDICASMYGVNICGGIVAAVGAGCLCFMISQQREVGWLFLAAYFLTTVLLVNMLHISAYLSTVKALGRIVIAYLSGVVIFLLMAYVGYHVCKWEICFSIYLAMTCGLLVTDVLLVCFCLILFGTGGKHYFCFLKYFLKYPYLVWSGLALFVGLFVTNVFYWFEAEMKGAGGILGDVSQYNTAMLLAILIHFPGMMILEIIMRFCFRDKYVKYLSVIQNGTYDMIDKERETLQNGMRLLLFLVVGLQLTITLVCIALFHVWAQCQGIDEGFIKCFMMLAIGMFFVFCMYDALILLYYFSGYKEVGMITTLFALIVIISTIVCCKLGAEYYLLPLPVGGICGWILSAFIVRSKLKNINAFILCK